MTRSRPRWPRRASRPRPCAPGSSGACCTLVERAREFARGPGAPFAGLTPAETGTGDVAAAVAEAGDAFAALLRVPALAAGRSLATSADARAVLPLAPLAGGMAEGRDTTPWVTAVTWIAARALGRAAGAPDPRAAASRLFDALRLRRGVHDALALRGLGGSEESRWRAAALVRAALAHADWGPAGEPAAPAPWRDDHDVRWLIGAHESDTGRWFRREEHARFIWWCVLPALLQAAASPAPSAAALDAIEAWAAGELAAAEATGWRFDALLESSSGHRSRPAGARHRPGQRPLLEFRPSPPVKYRARVAKRTSRDTMRTADAKLCGTSRGGRWRILALLAALSALTAAWAEAEPAALAPGLYDIEVRIHLPYVLEVSPPKRVTRCLTAHAIESGQAFFVLSENPIRACPVTDYRATPTTARYQIRCPGANAASAEGDFESTATGYRGTISMQMGGKNMTMSETQVAVRVGACAREGP